MNKILSIVQTLSVIVTVLFVIGFIKAFLHPSMAVQPNEAGPQESIEVLSSAGNKYTDGKSPNKLEETEFEIKQIESDIEKKKIRLKMVEDALRQGEDYLQFLSSLPPEMSYDAVYELAQRRVLQCYEENVTLAVEIKALLMESLNVPMPSEFANRSATDDYMDYLKDDIVGGIIDQIASDQVKSIIELGSTALTGAANADGSAGDRLNDAIDFVIDGVAAKTQEAPYEMAENILDETTGGLYNLAKGLTASGSVQDYLLNEANRKTGGLIGTIDDIIDYDDSFIPYFQALSRNASESAEGLKWFLQMEKVKSGDIADMLYQYSQFGDTLQKVKASYDWKTYYDSMEVLYSRFVHNEVMIEMLNAGGQNEDTE